MVLFLLFLPFSPLFFFLDKVSLYLSHTSLAGLRITLNFLILLPLPPECWFISARHGTQTFGYAMWNLTSEPHCWSLRCVVLAWLPGYLSYAVTISQWTENMRIFILWFGGGSSFRSIFVFVAPSKVLSPVIFPLKGNCTCAGRIRGVARL